MSQHRLDQHVDPMGLPWGIVLRAEDAKGFRAVEIRGETICYVKRITTSSVNGWPIAMAWRGYHPKTRKLLTGRLDMWQGAAIDALHALGRYPDEA